jgi:hypothetical protein
VKTDGAYSHIKSLSKQRERLVDWVHKRLIGPPGDSNAPMRLPDAPANLFVTAVLFPIIPDVSGIDPASLPESDNADNDMDQNDSESVSKSGPVADKKIRYIPPSSAGLSCYVSEYVEIDVFPWAVSYELINEKQKKWNRIPTGQPDELIVPPLQPPKDGQSNFITKKIWNDRAEITALWRNFPDG